MLFKSKAKHVKNSLIKKTTSLGLVGLLVAAGLVATVTPSQAEPVVTDLYCGEQSFGYLVDYDGANPTMEDNFVRLELNDFSMQWFAETQILAAPRIGFANGASSALITTFSLETVDSERVLRVEFDDSGIPEWPVSLESSFSPQMNISNSIATFRDFEPCTAQLDDIETGSNEDAFDGDYAGQVSALMFDDYDVVSADTFVRMSVVDGVTTFSYTSYRVSDAEADGSEVDVNVTVTFEGNTVTWSVNTFLRGTSTPAALTFFIGGNLGSDGRTETSSSNGITYTSDRYYGDPVVVFASNSSAFSRNEDRVRFSFEAEESGFLEVSVIGYDPCTTDAEVQQAVDDFIDNYQSRKNTDVADVIGAACSSECQPSTATLERSPGVFDVGGTPLCFDSIFDSNDPPTFFQQISRVTPQGAEGDLDIGNNLLLEGSVEYQNVARGGDVTLNAILTLSSLVGNESEYLETADYYSFRNNSWIRAQGFFGPGDSDRYFEYTLEFFVSGDVNRTPVSVSNLSLDAYDIDNYQLFSAGGVNTYSLSSDTILRATASGSQLRVVEEYGDASGDGEESRLSLTFNEARSFVFRMGVTGAEPDFNGATYGLDFTGVNDWEVAPEVETFKPGRTNSGGVITSPAPSPVFAAKRTISRFTPESPRLLDAQRTEIRKFLRNNPELSSITCTGYTAGPVKRTDKILAKQRATNVCAYIERIKPEIKTKVAGKTPGLPLSPLSRKVIIRGYSATP